MTSLSSSLERPMMPTQEDEARAVMQFARLSILMDDWDTMLEDWRDAHIGDERAQIWGLVDTSSNTLSERAKQLSTPGLYGSRPTWSNQDAAAEALVGERGLYDQAGWSSKMVFVNYLTIGLGDWFVRYNVNTRGQFLLELVPPHDIFLQEDPNHPGHAEQLWRLTQRYLEAPEAKWVYVWEVYDLGCMGKDKVFTRPPSFRIYLATQGARATPKTRKNPTPAATFRAGGLGEDISHRFGGELVGENYPWLSLDDGLPVLPWSHYQDQDTGMLWNNFSKRGATRGAMNAALYWTYVGHCARDATGGVVIIAGLEQAGVKTVRDPQGGPPVQTHIMEPGSMVYHTITDDKTPIVKEIAPSVNLTALLEFANQYDMKQSVRAGLNPSDTSRTNANPSSGAALVVSNQGKRDFSAQVQPVFRHTDLAGVKAAAIVARVGGLGTFPESGYSIQYHSIPLSPAELKERREELLFQTDEGMASDVDQYRALHPGVSEADAMAALIKVAVEQATLKQAIGEALEAAGLAETTPDAGGDIELATTDLAKAAAAALLPPPTPPKADPNQE
jgi:hypothetical protein